jgi:dTDP-glucose pyrophosphorylase
MLVRPSDSVQSALKKLNKYGKKVLLVSDSTRKLLGTLSDGDLRAFVITGQSLKTSIHGIFNPKPLFLRISEFDLESARKLFLENVIDLLPILDEQNKIVDFISWHQAFSENFRQSESRTQLRVPVVIMAGGFGTRLKPFTRIIPKPLIPIGEKPVVEIIMDEFFHSGVRDFYLTLNYKANIIESYFNGLEREYQVNFIREKKSLGTAGSLRLLIGKLESTFIVSNCDVIVKADFSKILNFHRLKNAALTIVSSVQNYRIPYGVIKSRLGGKVVSVVEKPELTFTINSGVYIIEPDILEMIPPDESYDMPELIKALIVRKKGVFHYPTRSGQYIDIGQWDEFKSAARKLTL